MFNTYPSELRDLREKLKQSQELNQHMFDWITQRWYGLIDKEECPFCSCKMSKDDDIPTHGVWCVMWEFLRNYEPINEEEEKVKNKCLIDCKLEEK